MTFPMATSYTVSFPVVHKAGMGTGGHTRKLLTQERTITPVAGCDCNSASMPVSPQTGKPRGLALRRCERERLHGQGP